MKFIGTRFQLTKPNQSYNIVPVGTWATVGTYYPDAGYAVGFDDNEAGEDMGWCFYSAEEIDEQIQAGAQR